MNAKTNLSDAMALKLQGLCDMLELIKPFLDALPENKRRNVPGLNWIQSAIDDAREIRQEYVDSKVDHEL